MEYFDGRTLINIRNIEDLQNLSQEAANDLATGPQDLFFDKLQLLNNELEAYGIKPIDVTNKWNWKPGSYDRIREYLLKKLDINKKCMSVDKLLHRTSERTNYMNYIKRQAVDMEKERANIKRLGLSKDVDVEVFKEKCIKFVDNLISECEKVYEATNKKVLIVPYVNLEGQRNAEIILDITMSNLTMSIFDKGNNIQDIPIKDINIIVKQSLRHKVNDLKADMTLLGYYDLQEDKSSGLRFVYISGGYRYRSSRREYGTVCLDAYHSDITKAINNNNLLVASMHLMNWAQYYDIKHSNPYNQPFMSHVGFPEGFSDEYKAILDKESVTSYCSNNIKEENIGDGLNLYQSDYALNDVCNSMNCQLTEYCVSNIKANKRINFHTTEKGYQLEGFVGWLFEFLLEKHSTEGFTDMDLVNQDVGVITGSEADSNGIEAMMVKLYRYCQSKNMINAIDSLFYDSYTCDALEYWGLIDVPVPVDPDKTAMDVDELETLMKQWAASQRR